MYFTKSYAQDPTKIEMSFDCSNYQHQFRMDHGAEVAPVPFQNHVFQSIFLDKRNKQLWTIDEIDRSKIIETKWWHQVSLISQKRCLVCLPCYCQNFALLRSRCVYADRRVEAWSSVAALCSCCSWYENFFALESSLKCR
jgi:hypothetical protein